MLPGYLLQSEVVQLPFRTQVLCCPSCSIAEDKTQASTCAISRRLPPPTNLGTLHNRLMNCLETSGDIAKILELS